MVSAESRSGKGSQERAHAIHQIGSNFFDKIGWNRRRGRALLLFICETQTHTHSALCGRFPRHKINAPLFEDRINSVERGMYVN